MTRTSSGGGGRNRTAVRGFAGPCLNHSATPPAERRAYLPFEPRPPSPGSPAPDRRGPTPGAGQAAASARAGSGTWSRRAWMKTNATTADTARRAVLTQNPTA